MELKLQIYSLIYSLVFGFCFYYILDIFNKYIVDIKLTLKIILSILFVIIISIIYFMGLLYLNYGYLHMYFLLTILVGYIFASFFKIWFTDKNKKSKM